MRQVIVALMALAVFSGATSDTQAREVQKRLSLSALGQVKAAPDMAIIRLGVIREAATAGEAVQANNAAMGQVIRTVLAANVAKKDVQTSGFSVSPRYVYPPKRKNGAQLPPRIVGYSVSNNIAVIVRDLTAVGSILDAVVSAGSNRISGISFSISNPEPLRNEARRRATATAIAKAKLYAKAAGFQLGDIISLREQGGLRPPRPVYARAAEVRSFKASPVPVARGEQSITSRVSIVWEIK